MGLRTEILGKLDPFVRRAPQRQRRLTRPEGEVTAAIGEAKERKLVGEINKFEKRIRRGDPTAQFQLERRIREVATSGTSMLSVDSQTRVARRISCFAALELAGRATYTENSAIVPTLFDIGEHSLHFGLRFTEEKLGGQVDPEWEQQETDRYVYGDHKVSIDYIIGPLTLTQKGF